ncbi:hypothetical protein Poli38472_013820 [Pythium oligandrum]|uniref:Uncharacterized protein n=1 Tax=Pythium oligandrum TaxID=41045 RepID=A0A8K1C2A0_PYTOL|nr:hypothetical protein Poli38472_013820 [Pythium oligandrum]|eukprot:TMW55058.1 hypothetical protein Poli38472_013820 [Pythium oligandrum]
MGSESESARFMASRAARASAQRELRPAEAGSDTDGESVERGHVTMAPETEWDGYMARKHVGVIRNDRTPLNTPYTPHLVKFQLTRLEEDDDGDRTSQQPFELGATLQATLSRLLQPFGYLRSGIDRIMWALLPAFITQSVVFEKHRHWVVWYLTTILSIPFVMLLSPMVIALCICTSPIWLAGMLVLFIRAFVSLNKPQHLDEDSFTHNGNGHILNGTTHHDAVYRRPGMPRNGMNGH